MPISLPSVTLLAADTINPGLALRALALSCASIRFARAVLLTDRTPQGAAVPAEVEVVKIPPLESRDQYSNLMLKGLLPFVSTAHVLVIQWDGYVLNPTSWTDRFLEYDYIGARWPWPPPGFRVGNGGFSLRSRRLLEALQHPGIRLRDAEDMTICQAFRSSLETGLGIRFADEATADSFAFETTDPVGSPFGFHGLYNFSSVMSQAELAALTHLFSDAIATSLQCRSLLEQCIANQQWEAALAVADRMARAMPTDVALGEQVVGIRAKASSDQTNRG